jgi:hypothetical protein
VATNCMYPHSTDNERVNTKLTGAYSDHKPIYIRRIYTFVEFNPFLPRLAPASALTSK